MILSRMVITPNLTGDVCMTFSYHMYGDHIAALYVYQLESDKNRNMIWKANGNKGNQWNTSSVDVSLDSEWDTAVSMHIRVIYVDKVNLYNFLYNLLKLWLIKNASFTSKILCSFFQYELHVFY